MSRKKEEIVRYWEKELKAGLDYRKKYGQDEKWIKYKNYYRSEWKDTIVPVNRIFSYGRSILPRVYFRNPSVTVTPRHPRFIPHARVVEALDNWLIREVFLKGTLKKAALQSYLCGTGPIKLGFDSEFGYNPEQAVNQDGESATQEATQEERKIEYQVNVKPGMPWALSCPPDDIIIPWGYSSFESLPWIAHTILRPLEDVKQDQKYKNTDKLKGGYKLDKPVDKIQMWRRPESENLCLLYEIRDVKTHEVIVLCESEVILKADDALQIEGLPWEFIIFNEDPDYFWGIPDVKVVEEQQKELNEIRTQASKHRKLAFLKFLVLKGYIEDPEKAKLFNEDVTCLEVKGDSILNAIQQLTPGVPPDLWRETAETLADFRETLGFSRNQAGEFVAPQTPRTATEVAAVREASEIRSDERRDIVADVLVNIIRKWNQFIFKFWTKERVIQVAGPEGAMGWVSYTGDQLRGEYNLMVEPDSGLPITRSLRLQQAQAMFKLLNQDMLIDQLQLRKLFLQQNDFIDPSWSLIIKPPGVPPGAQIPGTGVNPLANMRLERPEGFEQFAGRFGGGE